MEYFLIALVFAFAVFVILEVRDVDELLEEIQKLREYKTKYEYAEKDKKEMSDLLYKYMMAEYEGKSYDERVREYEKKHMQLL